MISRNTTYFPPKLRSLKFFDFANDDAEVWDSVPLPCTPLLHDGGCLMKVKEIDLEPTEQGSYDWRSSLPGFARQHACAGTLWDLDRIL